MSITGLEDISFSKEEVKENREGSINTTRTLIFKHEATAGQLIINTTALVTPSEAASYGFTQPSGAELADLNLLVNKKNLKVHSSRGVWLQMYEDFLVTGATTIELIGAIRDLGGALANEVFTVYATPVQANSILTTDAKKMYQEYVLADGQTTLNLGREYSVNQNPLSQIGAIRVFRNGVGPQLRNVGNATASPSADGNYQEIDAGSGIGTQIEFNVAPSGQDDTIVVEFGLEYAGDLSIVGDIQSLYGAFKKLVEDSAVAFGWPESRYLSFNPSEVERRGFGDLLYSLQNDLQALSNSVPSRTPALNTGGVGQVVYADISGNVSGTVTPTTLSGSASLTTTGRPVKIICNTSFNWGSTIATTQIISTIEIVRNGSTVVLSRTVRFSGPSQTWNNTLPESIVALDYTAPAGVNTYTVRITHSNTNVAVFSSGSVPGRETIVYEI